jgi:hypothetical protein
MLGGIERQVAEIDQVGLKTTDRLRSENLAWPLKRFFVQLRSGGQYRLIATERK